MSFEKWCVSKTAHFIILLLFLTNSGDTVEKEFVLVCNLLWLERVNEKAVHSLAKKRYQ